MIKRLEANLCRGDLHEPCFVVEAYKGCIFLVVKRIVGARIVVCRPPVPLGVCKSNDEDFCRQLAALCDYYVNDAFGTAHRAHASTEGITKFVERKVCRSSNDTRNK